MIKISNLHKVYKHGNDETNALNNINFTIDQGEKFLIKGVSGAGKSSLINILGFIDFDYTGEYLLNGKNSKKMSSRKIAELRNKEFGYIFQEYALVENESVFENIKIPLLYSKTSPKDYAEKINKIISLVDLNDQRNKKVKHLSGGQRQRVAIARALINEPNIIIADEPTGSLNKDLKEDIFKILINYVSSDKTLILITHDTTFINENDFSVIHLDYGSII